MKAVQFTATVEDFTLGIWFQFESKLCYWLQMYPKKKKKRVFLTHSFLFRSSLGVVWLCYAQWVPQCQMCQILWLACLLLTETRHDMQRYGQFACSNLYKDKTFVYFITLFLRYPDLLVYVFAFVYFVYGNTSRGREASIK